MYCHVPKDSKNNTPTNPNRIKSKLLSFYESFRSPLPPTKIFTDKETLYKRKSEITPSSCFEQYLLYFFLHNSKLITQKFQKEEIPSLLQSYPIPNLPENIKTQFVQECEKVLDPLLGMEKDKIIHHLIQYMPFWEECNANVRHMTMIMEWIPEGGVIKPWLIKMVKVFILGILPNIEKRKKGKEFRRIVIKHFYQIPEYF